MKRFLLALALVVAGGLFTTASAHHGHWGGWGGYGHRHIGYYGGGWGGGWGGYRNIGWGGYNSFAFGGYYPRVVVANYAPAYYRSYYAPAYVPTFYAPRYYAPASYYYPSCSTTTYSNVIASYTPPAEYYYGPQAAQRFLGTNVVNNNVNNQQAANAVALAANLIRVLRPQLPATQVSPAAPVAQQDVFSVPTESLPIARARARKMMELGDRYFAEQKYFDAAQKYQEATRTAADLSEAQFRLAHAQTALGRIPEAAAAYRQALASNPDIRREGFQLDQLYGDDQIAKTSHLESAAGAALEAPNDTSYLLVVGMFLQYDGQGKRAEKFLHKAWEQGDRAPNLARFWNAEEPKVLVVDQEI